MTTEDCASPGQALERFLLKNGLSSFHPVLLAQGIASLDALKAALADNALKQRLVGTYLAEYHSLGAFQLAQAFGRLTVADINAEHHASPGAARLPTPGEPLSADGLKDALGRLITPLAMTLACFRESFPEEQHFRRSLQLPAGYKILSGGARTLEQKAGNFLVSSYPSCDPATGRWAWHAQMKDIQNASPERHEIAVIALFDPDNQWDVRLFEKQSLVADLHNSLVAGENTGYVITGGGAQIDTFSSAALTACGFIRDPAAGEGRVLSGFAASSRWCQVPAAHRLKVLAIGVLPSNGSHLESYYQVETFASAAHHNHCLQYAPKVLTPLLGSGLIGGGACTTPAVRNFLTGCCPLIDSNGNVEGWQALSKDHIESDPTGMVMVGVGLLNVTRQPC